MEKQGDIQEKEVHTDNDETNGTNDETNESVEDNEVDQEKTQAQVEVDQEETPEGSQQEEFSPEDWQNKAEEWHKQWQEAEQKAEEHYQKYLRAQADLDNFRRRTRMEKEEQAKYAAQSLVEKLLPVVDNFERALAAGQEAGESEGLVKGVEMVFNQLQQALEAEGVEVIPAVGEPFDPHVHEAVMQVESDEYESGVVVEQLQKGYKLKDKVIRPSMVKVNS